MAHILILNWEELRNNRLYDWLLAARSFSSDRFQTVTRSTTYSSTVTAPARDNASLGRMLMRTWSLAGPPIAHLPRELVNLVVGHLKEDKDALASCTLVSQYWRDSARPLLFRTIFILHDHHVTRKAQYERCGGDRFPVDAFLKFLHDPPSISVDVPFLIKVLKVSNHWASMDNAILDVADLDLVLAKLPALEELVLRHISLRSVQHGTVLHGWSHPKALAKLVLYGVSMELPSGATPRDNGAAECAFVEFFSLFGTVKIMQITNVAPWFEEDDARVWLYWDEEDETKAAVSGIPLALRVQQLRLEFDPYCWTVFTSQADILQLLRYSASLRGLQSLQITEEPDVVHAVLQDVGNELYFLGLGVYTAENEYSALDVYGVSLCTSLSSCELNLQDIGCSDSTTDFGLLLSVINHVPSTVSYLTINIRFREQREHEAIGADGVTLDYLARMDWKKLEAMLIERPALLLLTFKFSVLSWDAKANRDHSREIAFIQEQLPMLVKKRLLGFECTEIPRSP
ncbi:hypothetical protein EIP91_009410 [Steccherinum ochraceum]|uniref:Uncharacterized protein n=1 Tax=Steccherinum ochraceum TaxID=92696 RepID=A0A4R0R3X7_9APHY|nr:hypothetical protein EIP91_009410 [Steccherinum ochraceum]